MTELTVLSHELLYPTFGKLIVRMDLVVTKGVSDLLICTFFIVVFALMGTKQWPFKMEFFMSVGGDVLGCSPIVTFWGCRITHIPLDQCPSSLIEMDVSNSRPSLC